MAVAQNCNGSSEPKGHLMQDLSTYFNRFIDNISLGEPQISRMERAAAGIMTFLRNSYGLTSGDVFMQGSYANGTAIEPTDGGEYDVDIIAVCVDEHTGPTTALNELERRFRGNGNYASRIVPRMPCVRLDYAEDNVGKFHVDVVPVRVNQSWASPAPLDAPRRNGDWHDTAPTEYTDWCAAQGERFVRTVKIMKRWRDEQQSVRGAIKSIVLQVLVAECIPLHIEDDQERLVETFSRLHLRLTSLSSPPIVTNPVLPSENLARKWEQPSFDNFKRELLEGVKLSGKAAAASDKVQAIDAWRELLGEDFPSMSNADLGLKVADFSHAQSFAERGWQVAYDPRYRVTVSATIRRGRYSKERPIEEEQLIFASNKLKFTANVVAPNHVEVWWQIANTGGHARSSSSLRGGIFKAKLLSGQPSPQQHVNWEDTMYTGVHLVRAILVRDRSVVSASDWRKVNVYARNHPFRL
jgi:hypothetical protein